MRRPPLTVVFLSLSACYPDGQLYPGRLPTLSVVVPCADTGGCDELEILDVGYGRAGSVTFNVLNTGLAPLPWSASVAPDGASWSLDCAGSTLEVEGSATVTLYYAPDSFDPGSAVVTVVDEHGGDIVRLPATGTTSPDADGDGYLHQDYPGGDDCNDFNANVNPGATEIWYDGVDQDCSGGSDFDADGDSFDHDLYGGLDCDDTDPEIHPDAYDQPGDGIDQNCDGQDG